MRMRSLTNGMAVCAAALAITAGACNTADRGGANEDANVGSPVGTSGEANNAAPITVTGCLQQGDGRNDLILTEPNELPNQPIATSGEQASPEVRQERQQAAANSYRLSGGPDNLREMIGHRVRVTGNRAERSNIAEGGGGEIDPSDLAEIQVESVQSVAETCGSGKGAQPRN